MTPDAFRVHYGHTLSALVNDLGAAEKMSASLHATRVVGLYELTQSQLDWLAKMPAASAPCDALSPPKH
jgi:hypothetical protein